MNRCVAKAVETGEKEKALRSSRYTDYTGWT